MNVFIFNFLERPCFEWFCELIKVSSVYIFEINKAIHLWKQEMVLCSQDLQMQTGGLSFKTENMEAAYLLSSLVKLEQ